jgi:hypothetical protein
MSAHDSPPALPETPLPMPGLAALLSFAVPGLGQIVQGIVGRRPARFAKGVLFLVVLLGMFFYGFFVLGQGKNVYVPHYQDYLIEEEMAGRVARSDNGVPIPALRFWFSDRIMPPLVGNLVTRWQYPIGQFWIGAAAWPALWNYAFPNSPILEQYYASPGALRKDEKQERSALLKQVEAHHQNLERSAGRYADIAWMYTVIAGALNLLVIYDAWAGPVRLRREPVKAAATRTTTEGKS